MKQTILLFIFLASFLFLPFTGLMAQNHTVIKGKVTDAANSDPVSFANIGIKGKPGGTFTDVNGFYKIELEKGEHVLVYSCIGYEKLEHPINIPGDGKPILLDILMKPTAQELNTVVVSGSRYEQKVEESPEQIQAKKTWVKVHFRSFNMHADRSNLFSTNCSFIVMDCRVHTTTS